MSPVLQSALFFLLAGFGFLLIGSLASAGLARACAGRIADLDPRARHRVLVVLALLPVCVALALLLSASLPSLISLWLPELDHCLTHDDLHAHLCFVHLPGSSINLPVLLAAVFVTTYALLRAALSIAGMLRAMRLLRTITSLGVRRADLDATLLDTRQPICFAAGLLRPSVLISRGLFESLSDDERAIVLSHEHEHVRRKDALVVCLVRACSAVHLPPVARWLVRETEIAAEQVCDERAGVVTGDRAAVAAAILAVERATQRASSIGELGGLAVGAGACAIERRVQALLAERAASSSLRPLYAALALAAAGSLSVAESVHHATESVLSLLLH